MAAEFNLGDDLENLFDVSSAQPQPEQPAPPPPPPTGRGGRGRGNGKRAGGRFAARAAPEECQLAEAPKVAGHPTVAVGPSFYIFLIFVFV